MDKRNVILILTAILSAYIGYTLQNLFKTPQLPNLPLDQWWGLGEPPEKLDTGIRPYEVEFTDEMLTDLKARLSRTRAKTPPLEGVAFEYGFNSDYMDIIVDFWKNKYDFKSREEYFNKYPNFVTNIQGLNIHFIHVKPKLAANIKVLPLLILHGWAGSVREFYEIIPKLVTPRPGQSFVFEVIVPSLPGFGFSQATSKTGLSSAEMGVILRNLMHRIGHEKFFIQGGDWGSFIGANMATIFPNEVLGYHSNLAIVPTPTNWITWFLGSLYPTFFVDEKYVNRVYPLSKILSYFIQESGYLHIQATKPDTIGMSLNDSPVGLAAWILEKFSSVTNINWLSAPDGNLTKKFTLTDLLDNVMVYWSTNSATTSARIYAEGFNKRYAYLRLESIPTPVPTAVIKFRWEIAYQTDSQIRTKYPNLVHSSTIEDGGHFAAMENPDILADDIWIAVRKFLDFHEKNKDK